MTSATNGEGLRRAMERAGLNGRQTAQQLGSRLPPQLVTLIDHETKAVAISEFQEPGMPGLLQTGDYARPPLSHSGNVPAEEVEDRVAARLIPPEPVQPGSAGAFHLLCENRGS